jgi:two-component system alkaline phosphatase synthesis response regulator PhoP
MKRILVVEDDLNIQKMLEYDLKQLGYHVDIASDGQSGLQKALTIAYDVIVLDLMMPKMNGIEVCRHLRKENHPAHVIMLTAMDDEIQKLEGFDVGADDYMTKPFSPRELSARIKAALRKSTRQESQQSITYQNIVLDPRSYEAYQNGEKLNLTLKEFELLHYMMENQGLVLSRDQLLKSLWGYSYDGDTRVVDVHIFKLRDKIDPEATMVKTIRGVGYKLV